jgi:queuosine precursor transporter
VKLKGEIVQYPDLFTIHFFRLIVKNSVIEYHSSPMNELLFTFHLTLILAITYTARRLGRDALIGWVILQPLLANLFVLKQITLCGFHVTCSDVYAVSAMLGVNFLQEYYGKETAKKALQLSLAAMLFFVLMSLLHLFYQPSSFDTTQNAYEIILGQSPRLFIASIGCFLLMQQIDLHIFAFLKQRCPRLPLRIRNVITLSFSQVFDSFFFTIFALSGILSNLTDIFLVSILIKCAIAWYLALCSPETKKITI